MNSPRSGPPGSQNTAPTRAERALAFLALVLFVAGLLGSINGFAETIRNEVPHGPISVERPTLSEATEALSAQLELILWQAPLRQALGGANALISFLILVSGGALLGRRRWATWLGFQALLAKSLWTLLEGGSRIYALWLAQTELSALFEQLRTAAELEKGTSTTGALDTPLAIASVAVGIVVQLTFLVWIAWRIRRPDIVELTKP